MYYLTFQWKETLSVWWKVSRFGEIDRVLVFESNKPMSEIVLHNGEAPHEADMPFLIHSFCEGKVEGVRECTSEFILPPTHVGTS